jgi:rubrerythrin
VADSTEKLIKIFAYALEQEKTGLAFFQSALERISAASARSAFEKLVDEENKHIAYITGIIQALKSGKKLDQDVLGSPSIDDVDYFEARAQSELLEQSLDESMIPDVTVFNTAWLIEKDLSAFYAKMADEADDQQAIEAFTKLARWEKTHEEFFRAFRDKLTSEYSQMAWGG